MDPVVIAGGLAVAFALLALMLWRRAADLEEQVRALEAKLADRAPTKESAPAEAAKDDAAEDEAAKDEAKVEEEDEDERAEAAESNDDEEEDEASDDDEEEDEEEDDEEEDDEEEVAAAPAPPTEQAAAPEPVAEAEPPEPVAEPAAPAEPAPPPKAEPDPRRLEALKIVSEAFELARYLDFDAIVEKPSTYRVTIPITAANGKAVRFLEDGMFTCLAQVRIEDDNAVLHIDTGKGPP